MTVEAVLGEALIVAGILGVVAKVVEQPSRSSHPVTIPVSVKDSENSKKP